LQYKHITLQQRIKIEILISQGISKSDIAHQVDIHPCTLSRELKRCLPNAYNANMADAHYRKNKRRCGRRYLIDGDIKTQIDERLKQDWSPEQIQGYFKDVCQRFMASHETIYQYIYRNKNKGGNLYKYLRRKRKYRQNRTHTHKRRGQIPNRISISERPDIVDQRIRIGDFEGDLIIGKAHKRAVISLVDRKSLYTLLRVTHSKEASVVSEKICKALHPLINGRFHTLTFDNGLEFADHKNISNKLGKLVYFADPYSPWQRGCNENTNGLVRQYLPKGMDFSNLTPQKLHFIQEKLNHRPRKKLGYRTPYEVFFGFFALNS
jgi:transposase, IS30 family